MEQKKVRLVLVSFILFFLLAASAPASQTKEVYYCVQVLSSKKLTRNVIDLYFLLKKKYPDVRIEKINDIYTVRVGFWREYSKARRIFLDIKTFIRRPLLRRCFYKRDRWVYPRFRKKNQRNEASSSNYKRRKTRGSISIKKLFSTIWNRADVKEDGYRFITFPETRVSKKTSFHLQQQFVLNIGPEKKSYKLEEILSHDTIALSLILRKNERLSLNMGIPYLYSERNFGLVNMFLGIIPSKIIGNDYLRASLLGILLKNRYIDQSFMLFVSPFNFDNRYNDLDYRKVKLLFLNYDLSPQYSKNVEISLLRNVDSLDGDLHGSASLVSLALRSRKVRLNLYKSDRVGCKFQYYFGKYFASVYYFDFRKLPSVYFSNINVETFQIFPLYLKGVTFGAPLKKGDVRLSIVKPIKHELYTNYGTWGVSKTYILIGYHLKTRLLSKGNLNLGVNYLLVPFKFFLHFRYEVGW